MSLISVLMSMMVLMAPMSDKVTTEQVVKAISDEYPGWSQEYKLNVFDCSEMSSYISACLDAAGVENRIVIGTNGTYTHAWVETADYKIECTMLALFGDKTIYNQGWSRYVFNTYKEIPNGVTTYNQLDWWNSPMFLEEVYY